MATSNKKKKIVVGKDDLRRLMKEKTTLSKTTSKRIDSPLARYNNLGHLSCVLCSAPVKSELLWNAHIQGRTHKENVARLKAEKEKKEHCFVRPLSPPSGKKRKHDDAELISISKSLKGDKGKSKGLPADFFDSEERKSKPQANNEPMKPRSILKTSAQYQKPVIGGNISGIGGYDSSGSENEEENAGSRAQGPVPPATADGSGAPVSGLPSDFFDQEVVPSTSAEGSANQEALNPSQIMSEKLPEGFFDDPKMDAKIRKVEYIDKMDEEWALFQRAMKDETHTSEAILAEDDEEANEERNLTEVEEQLKKWTKIDELAKKKEAIMAQEKESVQESAGEDEDDDEDDFDEFLDWRSKEAWK